MPNKIIPFNVAIKSTATRRSYDIPKAYTNDLNSVEFQFTITDMTAEELTTAKANVLLYMLDGSFFENNEESGVTIEGNVVTYTMKSNEGNHSGVNEAQVEIIYEGAPDKKLASQKYEFEIINGLDMEVAVEIVVKDWSALTTEARKFIDDSTVEVNALKTELQNSIETANTSLGEFDIALQNGIIGENIAAELQNLEETYAPDLFTVKQQLEQKADIADLPSSAYTFKGSTTFALLPTTGNTLGDLYYVTDGTPQNYAWTGTAWTPIGNGAFADGTVTNIKLAADSVTPDKISKTGASKTYDLKLLGNVVAGGYVDGYNVEDQTITVKTGYSGHSNLLYNLNAKDTTITFDLNSVEDYWGKAIVLVTSANVYLTWKDADQTRTGELAFPWLSYDGVNQKATIDVAGLRTQFPTAAKIYLEYANAGTLSVTRNETIVVSELAWLDISELTDDIASLETNVNALQNKISLVLPSRVYGVVGKEMNIYLDNALLNSDGRAVEALQAEAMSDSETLKNRVIWTPTAPKTETISVSLYAKSRAIRDELKNLQVISVAEATGSGTKKVLIIGDSKVNNGFVSSTIKDLLTADSVLDVELLGTRFTWTADNKHEGRGGWSAYDYCNLATKSSVINAFWDADTSSFNFAKYMTTQGYTGVDYVYINLGQNDVGTYTNAQIISYYQTMVASIHAYNPLIKIIIGLPEGVHVDRVTNTTSDPKYNIFFALQSLRKELITTFDNRDAEKIWVCPMYLNMDLREDFDTTDVPLSFRDGTKTRKKVTDPSHQSSIGYRKNADTMYYTLKYIESLG